MDNFCGSPFWDLNITWNAESPDFTWCFQQTVLVWVPCAILWAFAIIDIYFIRSNKANVIKWKWKNTLKIICNIFLIIITLCDLLLAFFDTHHKYLVFITTPALKAATYILSLVLIINNKIKCINTSGTLFSFWIIAAFCGVVQFRTTINNIISKDCTSISCYKYVIEYIFVLTLCILNCFADQVLKVDDEQVPGKDSPELTSSYLSKLVYFWFDSTVWLGYKRPLIPSDFWKIKSEDSCKELVPLFQKFWKESLLRGSQRSSNQQNNVSILTALWRTVWKIATLGYILLIIKSLLVFVNPKIIKLLIAFVENGNEPFWHGIFYVLLMLAFSMLLTLALNRGYQYLYTVEFRTRTVLVTAIYRKALRISNKARKGFTVGEIVNLMAVDVERLANVWPYSDLIWIAPLETILALYFLWELLGPAVLSGLAVMILLVPINSVVARKIEKLQTTQMKDKDKRVRLINEILNAIKILKLYAWETSYQEQVLKIRNKELKYLKKAAYLTAFTAFMWSCAPFLVSIATFATYIFLDENNVLDAQKAFVSLNLFNILRFPFNILPVFMTTLIQGIVALKRINKFMNTSEIDPNNVSHDVNEEVPLLIENGTFSWGGQFELSNINIRIEEGTLVAIIGGVGSGKSSLISAFLGEMDKLNGRVNTIGNIAYVTQQAWIQNATVRENILFGKPYDQKLYNKVIEACALKADLDLLSGKDMTEIGEKGINLSGGQKQRISLARAIYNDADVFFFDDPLSAVDSHVGKHIFDKIIGPNGMLKSRTRVFVTHNVSYLPETDLIIVLKNGTIIESGNYLKLMDEKSILSEILDQGFQKGDDICTDEENLNDYSDQALSLENVTVKSSQRTYSHSILSVSESSREEDFTFLRSKSSDHKDSTLRLEQMRLKLDNKLIEEERTEVGTVKWKVYKKYIASMGLFICIFTVVSNGTFEVFSIGGNLWLAVWSNDRNNSQKNDMYLGVYGALGIGQAFSSVLCDLLPLLGCWYATRTMHEIMLKRILRAPMSFFDTTPLGRIISRFSKDVDIMDSKLPSQISNSLFCLTEIFAALFVISFSTPSFAFIILPVAVAYFLLERVYMKTSRQLKRLEAISRSPIYSHFSESISGTSLIRAFNVADRFIQESDQKVECNQIFHYPSLIATRWLAFRIETIGNVIMFFAALFAVLDKDTINPGILGLAVNYAWEITDRLNYVIHVLSEVETNIVAVERVEEYSNVIQEAPWEIKENNPNPNWPENGIVEFKNYAVRYRPGLDLILRGITFKIESGEKIGIVGRTGAGKSSLTLALFRILEAAQGSIFIDKLNISELGLQNLRSRLTIIPQDPVLFSGSLRLNLDPFEAYSDQQVWKSLEHSHLKTFVTDLPTGLNHEICESGENLSVGQRQLVCLARALLRKTKVLILDEATAAVDLETDNLIQKTIRTEFADCTILTIAHRLNTIMDSNRVLVLDKGNVIEFDTPNNLLSNKDSVFYKLAIDAGII